jgi:hypothetical protein
MKVVRYLTIYLLDCFHYESLSSLGHLQPSMAPEKTLTETGPVIDWDNDSRNSHNWPTCKRAYHSILLAVFGLVVY